MDEFALIRKHFAPLARGFPGALNLSDDAAVFAPPDGCELAVTTDAMCEGVHFLGSEDPALIARKLLRVNLSDLAAMGASPLCYLMAGMLPADTSEDWVARFAAGLAEDQAGFGIHLAGGDTTQARGPMSLCLTAIGSVPKGGALKRSGAKPGDLIFVSGTLGDAALGLDLLRQGESGPLVDRYLLPQPRLTLGTKLRSVAHACMDVSDGLLQDLGHVCAASQTGARLWRKALPLSDAAREAVARDASLWEKIYGGGDDYELLFTVPPEREKMIESLAKTLELPLTRIGEMTSGKDVTLLDENGEVLPVRQTGWRHFT